MHGGRGARARTGVRHDTKTKRNAKQQAQNKQARGALLARWQTLARVSKALPRSPAHRGETKLKRNEELQARKEDCLRNAAGTCALAQIEMERAAGILCICAVQK